MTDKILKALNKYKMIMQGDMLVAGVSGGADSVSLLHFLCGLRSGYKLDIHAVHINHNLRGEESDRDENFVRELCGSFGVPLTVKSLDIKNLSAKAGKSVEETARDERYRVFFDIAGEKGKIATAHTLSDSAETQIINLARGTGIKGLAGIPPVRDNIIRPLIFCTRQDVEEYCIKHSLAYVTDSSNLSDDYTRNKIRHNIIPAMQGINTSYLSSVNRVTKLLREDMEYLDSNAEELFREAAVGEAALSTKKLAGLPPAMLSRVIIKLLESKNISCSMDRIEMLEEMLSAGKGTVQLSEEYMLKCGGGFFALEPIIKPVPYFEVTVNVENSQKLSKIKIIDGKLVNLISPECKEFENNNKPVKKVLKNALDYDKIDKIIKLRQRVPADFIKLSGRGCTKTLKKLFNENKIPLLQRERLIVMTDNAGGVIWVEGFGAAEHCSVTDETKNVLYIEVNEE